ncbi:MAG TPA: hypothetical protein VE987_08375 [Polyangiaceae bacterium]|nr:hypothetical protein [Polyangiaceae bacterium]
MRRASILGRAAGSLIGLAGLVGGFAPATARADVSSWLAVGGGGALQRNAVTASRDGAAALTYSIGVGSSPIAPVVVGGLLRGTTIFGFGTDAGAAVRVASGGFARGDWGVALEGGALWRPWSNSAYGTWPLQAVLTGGSPWGFQLALGAELWNLDRSSPSAQGFFAALEIDLLRLTVTRQGPTERWWPNPNPAGGRATALAW